MFGTDHARLSDLHSTGTFCTFERWLVVFGTDHVCLGDLHGAGGHTEVAPVVGGGTADTLNQPLVVLHHGVPRILVHTPLVSQ